ncbi:unnamed protein product, partial [marine sediment metagenome]
EDALNTLRYFQLDGRNFASYLRDANFLGACRGFYDLFRVAEKRGQYKPVKSGMFTKMKQRIIGAIIIAERELWVPVPYQEAIDHFERRNILTREELEFYEAAIRRDSLTATGLSVDTIETRLKPALERAIADGSTLREFTKEIRAGNIVTTKGHAENIFRTNIMTSYNSGHAEAIWSPELREAIPAFLYDGISDDRTTDICASRIGNVYPRDTLESADVVAPCHYQCRSSLIEVWTDEWDGRTSALPTIQA